MTDIDFHPTASATRDLPPVVVPVLMRELDLAQQGRYPSVAVDRLYRRERFTSERERVEYLVTLYERLRAPLASVAAAKPRRRRRRK